MKTTEDNINFDDWIEELASTPKKDYGIKIQVRMSDYNRQLGYYHDFSTRLQGMQIQKEAPVVLKEALLISVYEKTEFHPEIAEVMIGNRHAYILANEIETKY